MNTEAWWISYISPFLSVVAVLISGLAYRFAKTSWRETHRPIVICRVETHQSGNMGTALKFIVENKGLRPAKEVRLTINAEELRTVLLAGPGDPVRQAVERCFMDESLIPILADGERVENSFGFLSPRQDSTWRPNSTLKVGVQYCDLDGREYRHEILLRIRGSESFAGSSWG